MVFFVVISYSQKKANGKIYIEHPALEIAKKFDEAFVKGDLETIKSLVAEDFGWRHASMRGRRGTLDQLLGRSNYLSKNIINFEIRHRGSAYPDAFEYKDGGAVDVKTYTWLTGYDKNTGVELNMPRNVNFRITEDGKKIAMFNKAGFLELAIYKSNPLITGGASSLFGLNYRDIITIKFD